MIRARGFTEINTWQSKVEEAVKPPINLLSSPVASSQSLNRLAPSPKSGVQPFTVVVEVGGACCLSRSGIPQESTWDPLAVASLESHMGEHQESR